MASQPNDFGDLLEFPRQIDDLGEAGMHAEARLLEKRFHQAYDALCCQIDDLRKARKYAEAVPLAERKVQVEEARYGGVSTEVAEALIDLAELLIAIDRSAEAEPLLQRALSILVRQPSGESALRERFSHIDTSRLVQSVQELKRLLTEISSDGMVLAAIAASPYRDASPEEERRIRERLERWLEEDRRRRSLAGAEGPTRLRSPPAPASLAREGRAVSQPPAAPARERPKPRALRSARTEAYSDDGFRAAVGMPSELRSPPPTPEEVFKIQAGRLAYQVPNHMWLGVQETVEVRLGAEIANEIVQGFVGRGDVKLEHVPIVETMKVSLVCQPGTFDIERQSEEAQLVKPDLVKGTGFHQDDFARWKWIVTPRQRGKHKLFVKVSAAIKDSRGLPTTSSLPDKLIAVTVSVHLVRAAVGALRYIAPLVVSGVITALVGILTKDYWWPYVRDVIWPVVRAAAGMQ